MIAKWKGVVIFAHLCALCTGESLEDGVNESWRPGAPYPLAKQGFFYRDGLLNGYVSVIRDVPSISEKEPLKQNRTESTPTAEEELVKITEERLAKTTEEALSLTTQEETVQTTEQEHDWDSIEYEQELDDEQKFELSSALAFNCGDLSLGYEFSELTKHCYKFHAQAVESWYDAIVACEQEGAHLAIINSDDESKVLKKLFKKYPAEKIHGASYTYLAFVGRMPREFYDQAPNYGESLKEAGYEAWKPEAPHPSPKLGYFCRDCLMDVSTIRNLTFFCEKEPLKEESTPIIEEELAQTTEEETVQVTEDHLEPTTEVEPLQTTEEELAETTKEDTIRVTEENFGPTTEVETVQTTEEEFAETTKEDTVQVTEENLGLSTTVEPVRTTEEELVETTDLAPKSAEKYFSLHEILRYGDYGDSSFLALKPQYLDDDEIYGY